LRIVRKTITLDAIEKGEKSGYGENEQIAIINVDVEKSVTNNL